MQPFFRLGALHAHGARINLIAITSPDAFRRLRAAAGRGSLLFRQPFDAQTGTFIHLLSAGA